MLVHSFVRYTAPGIVYVCMEVELQAFINWSVGLNCGNGRRRITVIVVELKWLRGECDEAGWDFTWFLAVDFFFYIRLIQVARGSLNIPCELVGDNGRRSILIDWGRYILDKDVLIGKDTERE